MDSSVHMASGLLIAKYLVYTKVQYQAKRCYSKGEPLSVDGSKALFQNHSGLLCHSPMGTRQRFQIGPISANDTSSNIKFTGSYDPSCTTFLLSSLHLLKNLLLFQTSLKTNSFLGSIRITAA